MKVPCGPRRGLCGGQLVRPLWRRASVSFRPEPPQSFPAGDDEDGEQASAPPMTVQWPDPAVAAGTQGQPGQGSLGRGWRAADSLDGSLVPSIHIESGTRNEHAENLHGSDEGLHCRVRGVLHGSYPGLCIDRSRILMVVRP